MFKLDESLHSMMCLSIKDPTSEQRWYIQRALRANHRDDPFYTQRQKSHPFLQCDAADYILVEFWTHNKTTVSAYIAWLNDNFDSEVKRARKLGLI